VTLDRKPTLSSTTDGDMVCRIVRSEAKSAPWLLIGLSGSAGPFGGGGEGDVRQQSGLGEPCLRLNLASGVCAMIADCGSAGDSATKEPMFAEHRAHFR